MPAVASCGPLHAPPQQAARYPERARRGEGYRKARAFGGKGNAPGPSGLYHYFGARTEVVVKP